MVKSATKSVYLNRAEGPTSDLSDIKFTGPAAFVYAQRHLNLWGITAPKDQGYDKVDFSVIWENGEEYHGRFDLHRGGRESDGNSLVEHIHFNLMYMAELHGPAHLTEEEYLEQMDTIEKRCPGRRVEARNMLQQQQILETLCVIL